jgi:hypothetical protein
MVIEKEKVEKEEKEEKKDYKKYIKKEILFLIKDI